MTYDPPHVPISAKPDVWSTSCAYFCRTLHFPNKWVDHKSTKQIINHQFGGKITVLILCCRFRKKRKENKQIGHKSPPTLLALLGTRNHKPCGEANVHITRPVHLSDLAWSHQHQLRNLLASTSDNYVACGDPLLQTLQVIPMKSQPRWLLALDCNLRKNVSMTFHEAHLGAVHRLVVIPNRIGKVLTPSLSQD